jgi:hypothetical protein
VESSVLAMAVTFPDLVLAVHIMAVVVGFGVTFAYPLFYTVGERIDRRMLPGLHRLQIALSRRLTGPGLLVVLIAGIYLASHEHQWKCFYVQWGVAVVVVLGGLDGAFSTPRLRKLAEIGAGEVAAAEWSAEYRSLRKRVVLVNGLMSLLVLVTIVLMAAHVGA